MKVPQSRLAGVGRLLGRQGDDHDLPALVVVRAYETNPVFGPRLDEERLALPVSEPDPKASVANARRSRRSVDDLVDQAPIVAKKEHGALDVLQLDVLTVVELGPAEAEEDQTRATKNPSAKARGEGQEWERVGGADRARGMGPVLGQPPSCDALSGHRSRVPQKALGRYEGEKPSFGGPDGTRTHALQTNRLLLYH